MLKLNMVVLKTQDHGSNTTIEQSKEDLKINNNEEFVKFRIGTKIINHELLRLQQIIINSSYLSKIIIMI